MPARHATRSVKQRTMFMLFPFSSFVVSASL